MNRGLGWLGIVRLGLVQSAIGAVVVLCTATFNRVMMVEMALPASLPAALVAWHYVVQLSRPSWGFGSDRGRGHGARRTRFIVAGMAMLSLGALLAAMATVRMATDFRFALALAVFAFALIGAGVAAAGTTLLALLASRVTPARRPAAAAIAWVMMIVGIVITATTAGHFLDPYSPQRLVAVAAAVALAAFVIASLAVAGMERVPADEAPVLRAASGQGRFIATLKDIWSEPLARDFTIFVFLSMLAYSSQELIMEPFAALVFGYSVGHSTQLAGVQQGGVLLGMVGTGLLGTLIRGDRAQWMRGAILLGCFASAAALLLLAMAAFAPQHYPLRLIAFALGFANGVFAVSAIGLMMAFAGSGRHSGEGVRMGVWGAAQAIAFAIGGFAGAAGLDLLRHHVATDWAFAGVFGGEAVLFTAAALFALRLRAEAGCVLPARAWEGVS